MDAREKRLAQNETLFRAVNERIEEAAAPGRNDDGHEFEFLCECSNTDCNLRLPLTIPEYEEVRRSPVLFIVAPGHELPEIETVVLRKGSYQIVTKRGKAAEFVTEHDPRGG